MTEQTAAVELVACPFCGNAPTSRWHDCNTPGMEDCGYWGIDCCLAHSHGDSEEEAATAWNRRSATATQAGGEVARPIAEWHEDIGPVIWWIFPISEPPYVGTIDDDYWPGYHTHWTPIHVPSEPAAALGEPRHE